MQRSYIKRTSATSLDVERENFEKLQLQSITKAINAIECPVKEKHVRRILMGTFQEKNAQKFWSIVRRHPLQENPIVCWKFCHVLHKLLREGHRRVIQDSYAYRSMILDLGKMWGLLREGYGKLIQNYCTLLVNKIDFHARNQRFPGNLLVTDEELENIGEHDVNVFFQLCCELFDYLDEILCLQRNVFGSLDMSRSNSMTSAGQCRLAPLIPSIQDSSQLYDYIVKVLFKLHAALPASTLDGHRSRFFNQFKILKKFYSDSKNLQYFKNLIQVPSLPDDPPNFLIQSDLKSHVTPVVILPQQSDSPENETVDNLLDLSFNTNDVSEKTDDTWSFHSERNGSMSPSIVEEKDRVIQKLMSRIEEIELEMQQRRIEDGRMIDDLKRKINEMECAAAQKMEKELEELRQELAKHKNGSVEQTEVAKATDKFNKMKEIYNKLRAEHIELLRTKAEAEKQVGTLKTQLDEAVSSKAILENQLKENTKKEGELSAMNSNINDLQMKLNTSKAQISNLNEKIESLKHDKEMMELNVSEVNLVNAGLTEKIVKLEKDFLENLRQREWQLLRIVLNETQNLAKRVESEDIESNFVNVNCSPEFFFTQSNLLSDYLDALQKASTSIVTSQPLFDDLITTVIQYFYQLYYAVNCGKVTSQILPNIEHGQELMNCCKDLAHLSVQLSEILKSKRDSTDSISNIKNCLNRINDLGRVIIPEMVADRSQDLGDLLMNELGDMEKAIQDAANRIEQMILQAKNKDTGIKLEVNGKILDSCTTLMEAIKELVKNSKELQKEIVAQGKGNSSVKEFYQRNNRWTEGLISASKVVAVAAKLLVDAADKVVGGRGKFEELIVASQEIAAATAQLVVASRVKADKSSQKFCKLSASSKRVTEATGNVVATSKSCYAMFEEVEDMDLSKMTLHQAKRYEMESQVRVLELESLLDKERTKLSALRRKHYHLAGAVEGWDDQ